jgi:hypothetical protein
MSNPSRPASRSLWAWNLSIALILSSMLPACSSAETESKGDRKPVLVVHAWKEFLEYRKALASADASKEGASYRVARSVFEKEGNRFLWGYFKRRGGGDSMFGLEEWSALPAPAYDRLVAELSRESVQKKLEADAEDLVKRLGTMPSASDTVAFVFLVGGFQDYFTSYRDRGTNVIAVHLESFVPLPDDLDQGIARDIDFAITWRPDTLATLDEVAPWCTFAYTQNFLPELRERIIKDTASLAEYVLMQGFSTRLAGALYPESFFGNATPPVQALARWKIKPVWRKIGASWYELGTETYLSALFDERMSAELPEGTTAQQAVYVVGTELAGEWLDGIRLTPNKNEPGEISELGRIPTLSIWQLLEY